MNCCSNKITLILGFGRLVATEYRYSAEPSSRTDYRFSPTDYLPISVVPILSQVVEQWLCQPICMKPPMAAEITDRFAFRPTDSPMVGAGGAYRPPPQI